MVKKEELAPEAPKPEEETPMDDVPKEEPKTEMDEEGDDVLEALLVKVQQLENEVAELKTRNAPVEEKCKEQSDTEEDEDKKKEDLNPEQGERDTGETKKPVEPIMNTPDDSDGRGKSHSPMQIPDTTQPPTGTPPGEDLEDKMPVGPETNSAEPEDAKKEMEGEVTAGTAKDPTKPDPGASTKDPKPMEGASAQKLQKNKVTRPADPLKEIYNDLKKEILSEKESVTMTESLVSKQTTQGMSAEKVDPALEAKKEELSTSSSRVTDTVKEFLGKTGQLNLLTA